MPKQGQIYYQYLTDGAKFVLTYLRLNDFWKVATPTFHNEYRGFFSVMKPTIRCYAGGEFFEPTEPRADQELFRFVVNDGYIQIVEQTETGDVSMQTFYHVDGWKGRKEFEKIRVCRIIMD